MIHPDGLSFRLTERENSGKYAWPRELMKVFTYEWE